MNIGIALSNKMYNQGQIVLVPFPFTNQCSSIRRPALVISGKRLNNETDDIMLVQITKVLRTDKFSVPIALKDLTIPLKFISEIRCNKILIADQSLIVHTISRVTAQVVNQVIAKINTILRS